MQTLGEDILLLAIRQDGTIAARDMMHFALAGSELARLAALQRIEFVKGRIVVLDPAPTGDPLLDQALADMCGSRRPVRARSWVAGHQDALTEYHLAMLAESGAVRCEVHRTLGLFRSRRWFVADVERLSRLERRLDAIALSSGPVHSAQEALGGLVHAIGLDAELYPRHGNRAARKRLASLTEQNDAAWAVAEAANRARAAASTMIAAQAANA